MDKKYIKNINNIQNFNMNEQELFNLLDEIDLNFDECNVDLDNFDNNSSDGNSVDNNSSDNNDIIDDNILCKNCNTNKYIVEDYSQGISVCQNCGNVIGNVMDYTSEARNYEDNNNNNSCNRFSGTINPHLPQSSLGTSISGRNNKIKKLQGWNAMPYRERSLNNVLKKIHEKCQKAKILKCIEDDAKILFINMRNVSTNNKQIIIRGKNLESSIAACIFFACKRKNETRSLQEIAELFNLQCTEITKGCKTFLKHIKGKNVDFDFNSSKPQDFITRYCKKLNISKSHIEHANNISKNIIKLNIASIHTPLSVATGTILLLSDIYNLHITKKIISRLFNVSEVTISKTYKELQQYKNIILDDDLTDKLISRLAHIKSSSQIPQSLKNRCSNTFVNNTHKSFDPLSNNLISSDISPPHNKSIIVNSPHNKSIIVNSLHNNSLDDNSLDNFNNYINDTSKYINIYIPKKFLQIYLDNIINFSD